MTLPANLTWKRLALLMALLLALTLVALCVAYVQVDQAIASAQAYVDIECVSHACQLCWQAMS